MTQRLCRLWLPLFFAVCALPFSGNAKAEDACRSNNRSLRELCFVSQETGFSTDQILDFIRYSDARNIDSDAAVRALRAFSRRLYEIKFQSLHVIEFFAQREGLAIYRELRINAQLNEPYWAFKRSDEFISRLQEPNARAELATFLFGSAAYGRLPIN